LIKAAPFFYFILEKNSMSNKHRFVNSVIQVLKHNRDGAHRTQNDRRRALIDIATTIYTSGFQLEHVRFIKRKYIVFLVEKWMDGGISAGTIKNRMSHLRWLMEKLDRPNVVPPNDELNIPKRQYVTNVDKPRQLCAADLENIKDPLMQLNLRGQQLFGLRMEESLKIQPYVADSGDYLYIKGSWAKGGRERLIPILTDEQRQWLFVTKNIVSSKKSSLIPDDVSYKTYRKRFEKRCERAGIDKRHGLRHHYAQLRYRAIAGFDCVAKGGPSRRELSADERYRDRAARLQVSYELGHSRVDSIIFIWGDECKLLKTVCFLLIQ
jgi:site-specific recombinase XerC